MPLIFAKQEFANAIQAISQDNRPMRVVCYRKEVTEEGKELMNSLAFENNSFIESFGG